MKKAKYSCALLIGVFLGIGWLGDSTWAAVSETRAGEALTAEPVDFNFPLVLGNQWDYVRTITIRLGATIEGAPQRATISLPFQYSPNRFIVRLDGFNPFREDRPLFADISSTPNGVVFSRLGDGRLLKGLLLPSTLAVADILNHLTGQTINPRNLVFTVAAVNEPILVPAGEFKYAIQVNFSYADRLIGASGKVFLVSDVGIVKVDATFNGPLRGLGLSGTARLELRSFILK